MVNVYITKKTELWDGMEMFAKDLVAIIRKVPVKGLWDQQTSLKILAWTVSSFSTLSKLFNLVELQFLLL